MMGMIPSLSAVAAVESLSIRNLAKRMSRLSHGLTLKKKSEEMKTLTLFKVRVWVDDGWDVGSVEHLVLASNRE
jgi:hypothetical protein